MRLADVFLARLPAEQRLRFDDVGALEEGLADCVERSRAAWPAVRVPPDVFAAHLAHHCATGNASLAELRASDLYLACGCALGDRQAIAAFEAAYFADIAPALVRATRTTELEDEVAQQLREKLFLGRDGAPQLALYAGRGDLRNWTRTAIARVILNLVTRRPKEVPVDDELLAAIPATGNDAELAHMKATYRAEFSAAFEAAVETLSSRERNLLRHSFVDGLSVDEVGALFGVHRATAARWVAASRAKLMAGVRRGLLERLHIGGEELSSIMRLIRSQLHVTLARHLRDRGTDEP